MYIIQAQKLVNGKVLKCDDTEAQYFSIYNDSTSISDLLVDVKSRLDAIIVKNLYEEIDTLKTSLNKINTMIDNFNHR